ncbi:MULTISPECIES: element excision factor XisI family protein, partial [unclassified Microcoleus]|uniref:element excision factor XisI family protein n=1 Tax=unclassified Microcoleus TaxID=2642155 RepID=UPI002FD40219
SLHSRKFLPTLTWVQVERGTPFDLVEEDRTEDGIATDLLQAGVSCEDIVLAFHPPRLRPFTEFATA